MNTNPIIRVAHVKFSPNGKSYPARCDRDDILEGHNVEVLMRAGTNEACYMNAEVTSISRQRWNCSCHVVNHAHEVEYSFENSVEEGFVMHRTVDLTKKLITPNSELESERTSQKKQYNNDIPESSCSEMQELYEAIAHDDGEDVYLCDGVWMSADGSIHDRGR